MSRSDNTYQLNASTPGGTGADQTETFTAAAPAGPIVSLPDFTRGPQQAVNVPVAVGNTQVNSGLPISISGGAGVTSVQLTLTFNPNLLSISSVSAGQSNWTATLAQTASGQVTLNASGPALSANSATTIFSLTAAVPTNATYGASEILQITGLSLANAAGPVSGVAERAIHEVAYLGDADGDESYGGFDSSLIMRTEVGYDTGFDAYPLTDPAIIGDVNGFQVNGVDVLSGSDASLVAQAAVFLPVADIPDLPDLGGDFVAASGGADPVVAVASVAALAGEAVDVPLSIGNAATLLAADFTLSYDTSRLSLTDGDVSLGSLPSSGGWGYAVNVIVDKVGDQTGTVCVTEYGVNPLSSGSSNLLNENFQVLNNAAAGAGAVSISGGDLNDGALKMTPQAGAVTVTTGAVQWTSGSNGSWDSNTGWTDPVSGNTVAAPGLDNTAGDSAVFNAPTATTVTLDGVDPSVVGIAFSGDASQTIAQGSGGGTLQLDNGSGSATITVAAGNQAINVPVLLTSNLVVSAAAGSQLTVSGGISGAGQSLTVNDHGTVVLAGANGYTGGTMVSAGTLILTNSSAIAAGTDLTVGAGGILVFDPSVLQSLAGDSSPETATTAASSANVASTPAETSIAPASATAVAIQPNAETAVLTPAVASATSAGAAVTGPIVVTTAISPLASSLATVSTAGAGIVSSGHASDWLPGETRTSPAAHANKQAADQVFANEFRSAPAIESSWLQDLAVAWDAQGNSTNQNLGHKTLDQVLARFADVKN